MMCIASRAIVSTVSMMGVCEMLDNLEILEVKKVRIIDYVKFKSRMIQHRPYVSMTDEELMERSCPGHLVLDDEIVKNLECRRLGFREYKEIKGENACRECWEREL